MKREITITSSNAEISVTKYDVNIEGKSIEELLIKALKQSDEFSDTFRAKVSINIREIPSDLKIKGLQEEKVEVSEDGESEEL